MIPEAVPAQAIWPLPPNGGYRDNAGALMTPQEVMPVMRCHPVHGCQTGSEHTWDERFSLVIAGSGPGRT